MLALNCIKLTRPPEQISNTSIFWIFHEYRTGVAGCTAWDCLSDKKETAIKNVIAWKYSKIVHSCLILDCCFASTTGVNTSRGAIDWPITLHGIQAEVKCPFSKKADKQRAYRTCITDFINGPSWAGPDNADCQKASETTKKLKKLSEVMMLFICIFSSICINLNLIVDL